MNATGHRRALSGAAMAMAALSAAQGAVAPLRGAAQADASFLSLRQMAAVYGAAVTVTPDGRFALSSPPFSLEPLADGRRMRLQGIEVWLQRPLTAAQLRAGLLHRDDALGVADVLFRPHRHLAGAPIGTVVLDPGHGGRDGGAVGLRGLLEKELTLEIARAVRSRLAVAGVKVELTRDDDRLVELDERARLAARRRAAVFVSIHFNAAAESGSRGVETYIPAAGGWRGRPGAVSDRDASHVAADAALGFFLHRHMVRAAATQDRGLRRARFLVLRDAPCPAALVECGFLTDPVDAGLIAEPAHRGRIADGIARGILDYLLLLQRIRVARPVFR